MCEFYEIIEFLEKVNKQGYIKLIVNDKPLEIMYELNNKYNESNNDILGNYSRAEVQKISTCDDGYIYITLYM